MIEIKQLFLSLFFFCFSNLSTIGIEFTFANPDLSEDLNFLEFDIMAASDTSGTRLGDNQVYLNYNQLAFGDSISFQNRVEVISGILLEGELIPGLPLYSEPSVNDNQVDRLGIQVNYLFYNTFPEAANLLPTNPEQLLHLKIEISDSLQTSMISFSDSLMIGQQYQSNNDTIYDPVIAEDFLDIDLTGPKPPVINYIKILNQEEKVRINWQGNNHYIYKIYSSENPYSGFTEDLNGEIIGSTWTAPLLGNDKRYYFIKAEF